jgi:cytochrome c oxidase assembly protein subunit 11
MAGEMRNQGSVGRTVRRMLLIVVGMFGFGFALVPLYDVFCEVTGINGKSFNVARGYTPQPAGADTSREVKIQFVATNNDGMIWEFSPSQTVMRVHPGELAETTFLAHNPASFQMVGQAIPSVQPIRAAEYFHKTECFCFNQQVLAGNQVVDMPLKFIVDRELPPDIHTITLSYTLFDVTDTVATN